MRILFIFLLSACTTAPITTQIEKAEEEAVKPSVETEKALPPTEQEVKSLELFNEILNLIESSDNRQIVLPQVEDLYVQIIMEYPDAPLAQESHWRLIAIYVDDYSPPEYEKAEPLYYEFLKKYPRSPMKGFIEDTLGNSYYKNAKWDELLRLSTPVYKEYIEKGKRPGPSLIFMYAEANFNLGNFVEAGKGYRIVIELFPRLNESVKAKARLEDIRKMRENTQRLGYLKHSS